MAQRGIGIKRSEQIKRLAFATKPNTRRVFRKLEIPPLDIPISLQIAMSGVGPISQDWEPVVIRKKAPNAAAKKDEKAVNAARRAGAEIETVKKGTLFSCS